MGHSCKGDISACRRDGQHLPESASHILWTLGRNPMKRSPATQCQQEKQIVWHKASSGSEVLLGWEVLLPHEILTQLLFHVVGSSWQSNFWVRIISMHTFTSFTLHLGVCSCLLPAGLFILEAQENERRVESMGYALEPGVWREVQDLGKENLRNQVSSYTQKRSPWAWRKVLSCF